MALYLVGCNAGYAANGGVLGGLVGMQGALLAGITNWRVANMGKHIGSQYRDTVEEAGVVVVSGPNARKEIIIQDKQTSRYELWVENDHYAGAVIEYCGKGYEFVSSYQINP